MGGPGQEGGSAPGVEGEEDSGCRLCFPARRCRSTGTQSEPRRRRRTRPRRSASKPKVGHALSPHAGTRGRGADAGGADAGRPRSVAPGGCCHTSASRPASCGAGGFHEHRHVDVEKSFLAPEGHVRGAAAVGNSVAASQLVKHGDHSWAQGALRRTHECACICSRRHHSQCKLPRCPHTCPPTRGSVPRHEVGEGLTP